MKGVGGVMKIEWPGDSSYLLRENSLIVPCVQFSKVSLINSRINYFCVIDCAEHCVYIGIGTINCILGGRVVVGSAFYEIFLVAMWFCNSILQC